MLPGSQGSTNTLKYKQRFLSMCKCDIFLEGFQRFLLNLLRDLGLIWSLASLASWRHSQWNLGIRFSRFLTYATTKVSWLLILLPFQSSWSTLQLQTDLQSCLKSIGNQFEYTCFRPLQQAFFLDSSFTLSCIYAKTVCFLQTHST